MVIQGPYTSTLPQFCIAAPGPSPAQLIHQIAHQQQQFGNPLIDALVNGGPGLPQGCFGPGPGLPQIPAGFDAMAAAALIQSLRGASPFGPGGLPQGAGPGGGCFGSPFGGFTPGPGSSLAPYLQGLQGLLGGPGGPGAGGAMSTRDAASVLQQNFDQCSEKGKFGAGITKGSLEKVVASDTASPELKAAANTFLNNPQAMEVIGQAHKDGPVGGMTTKDLNTVLSPGNTTLNGLDALSPSNLPPGSEQHALATIRKHWDQVGTGKFGQASKGDLQRILGSDSAPPELKQAVSQVLNTPGLYDKLANAQKDGPFGISKADVNTLLGAG